MIILGIETSCDDTGVALVQDGREILGSLVASQVKLHAQFGGVVPEVASRKHLEVILALIDKLLRQTKLTPAGIDAIAVTAGPGLLGSLLIGINTAKTLAYLWNKPLIEVDHLVGHIYSNWLTNKIPSKWPILALIVSGGHTELVLMKDWNKFQSIGGTRDDAVGEAFDKAAKIMELGYPGGPAIAAEAAKLKINPFDPSVAPSEAMEDCRKLRVNGERSRTIKNLKLKIELPRPMLDDGLEMSFSGLKTALSKMAGKYSNPALAYEFQEAVAEVLVTKVNRAIRKYHPVALLLAGGVAANRVLRGRLAQTAKSNQINYFMPEIKYCMDNAAMVALAAYYLKNTKKDLWYNVKVKTNSEIALHG